MVEFDSSIDLIEHPVINAYIPKLEFYNEFKPILDKLNGYTMTDYMDFFYEKDIINNTNLKFIGEN